MSNQLPSPHSPQNCQQCLINRVHLRGALREQAEQAKQAACPAPACISRDDAMDRLYDVREHLEFIIHYFELCSQHGGSKEIDCRTFTVKTILENLLAQHFEELDAFISQ